MHKRFFFLLLPPLLLLLSCSVQKANYSKSYLNYKYVLKRAGDLHGLAPTTGEVLSRNPGFTSYIGLFSVNDSYVNFQCKGTSYNDFYCEGSFALVDKNGNEILSVHSFLCQYTGGQSGKVIYEDEKIKDDLGLIYVYTPYWCRWQFNYDVDGSGDKILLTFEFWKSTYNQLPDFINE